MENPSWSPPDLLQLSGGYWSACALHAGVKLDLFTSLAEAPRTADELATALGADRRGLEMLLNALAALDLLTKEQNRFAATPFAARFLSKNSSQYLGHIIRHHHHLMSGWARLDEAVRTGAPVRERASHGDEEAERESFLMGMFNLASMMAPQIVPHIDLAGRRRLLDLGGGPGTYAIHFCRANPELIATVFDLTATRPFAERTIGEAGLGDRITFAEGDFIAERIPGRYDVAWLSHILHGEGPEGCAVVLEKAVEALESGGMLLVHEFILDDTQDAPVFPALFSLNMLLGTPEGQSYSEGQICSMLSEAGLSEPHRLEITLPNGAGVIAATKP